MMYLTGAKFSAGSPTKLFDTAPYYFGIGGRTYDIAADGTKARCGAPT